MKDLAIFQAVKRHAEMLKLDNGFGSIFAHEFNRILVTQIVRTLDGVVHMPQPVIACHIAQRGSNAALCRHGVRARGEHLGQHGYLDAGFSQLQRSTQAGTAAAYDHRIKLMFLYTHENWMLHKITPLQIR